MILGLEWTSRLFTTHSVGNVIASFWMPVDAASLCPSGVISDVTEGMHNDNEVTARHKHSRPSMHSWSLSLIKDVAFVSEQATSSMHSP